MRSTELKRAKRKVRADALAVRDAIEPQERLRRGRLVADRFLSLPEVASAGAVMAFWSFGSELPTMPLIEALVARNVRVALPRTVDADLQPRMWRPGDPVTPTRFGAMEPAGGVVLQPDDIDVIATPGVAFDREGGRVGYGGGYYDRFFLRARQDALRAGIGYREQIVQGVLPGGHLDLRVDVLVTDADIVRCRRDR
jgi:5-formyltetrahydrofolate cyclo-ligase